MKLEARRLGPVSVVELQGSLSVGSDCQTLLELLHREIEAGRTRVVFDLHALRFVDSAGLGQFVALSRLLADLGGRLAVAEARGKVKDILDLTRLDQLLVVYPSLDQAVASFGDSPD